MIFRYRVHDVELPFRFQIDSKDTVEKFHITIEITAITGQGTYAKNVSLCSKDIITSSLTIAKKNYQLSFSKKNGQIGIQQTVLYIFQFVFVFVFLKWILIFSSSTRNYQACNFKIWHWSSQLYRRSTQSLLGVRTLHLLTSFISLN